MSQSKWIRIFLIPETTEHSSGHTLYKVTCSTFPVENPAQSATVTVWKRFSDFQNLYKQLSLIHKQLFLTGRFPPSLETKFFNRRQPEVIEQRKDWSLQLLEFVASQPLLNTHKTFTSFLFPTDPAEETGPGGDLETEQEGESDGLEVEVSSGMNIDTTPSLSPDLASDGTDYAADEAGVPTQSEEGEETPQYISQAAEQISAALNYEAEEQLEASLAAYRKAIGILLSSVQTDPDSERQAKVKRRIAQYISKAEQIVRQESELKIKRTIPKNHVGIPHLRLFGQMSELKNYKVRDVLANKMILAENFETNEIVLFKALHKSPVNYKKSKTSLLPINIRYMVKLLQYFETDDCVYLMLEWCRAGRVWEVVRPLVMQHRTSAEQQPAPARVSTIKPSQSFITERKKSLNASEKTKTVIEDSVDTVAEDFDNFSIVHVSDNSDSLTVLSDNCIEHFEGCHETTESNENHKSRNVLVSKSQKIFKNISQSFLPVQMESNDVLGRMEDIEKKVKLHLSGTISESKHRSELPTGPESVPEARTADPVLRPALLRKLSEVLPQVEDPELRDCTHLSDKLIRTWAAQLAQVLTSLHYREIVIRDLNPSNLLLDSAGQLKLTYQCEWVSVDSSLSPAAMAGHYCAPEVAGPALGEVTPAADWWSYGAILHLLYCGTGPSGTTPSGLDSSVPLDLAGLPDTVQDFLASLLQLQPENRLGAGTYGSLDVHRHKYFENWDWNKMTWK